MCDGRTYQTPKVSIITPTFRRNAEGLLATCLNSGMAQTFEELELIVVDDGSSDGSESTIRDAAMRDDRIVYLRHERNSGLPAVRTNEGVVRARGEAIAFLFDDNVFQPDFIESAWNALQRSGADVVHANVQMVTKNGKDDFLLGGWPLSLELLRNLNTIPNGGVLVRRSFFHRYGLYDPHILMRRICDWDLWLRGLALGAKFCHIDQIVSVEHGLRSPNSIGNTIDWDFKIACAYMLDETRLALRTKELKPHVIGDYDVLASSSIRPYVRDGCEWSDLVDVVYKPFIERHGVNGFDPEAPSNRSAAVDPRQGWNAEWSPIGNRRRYVVISNSISAWVSTWLHALRQQPGVIVVNCAEWQLSSFKPRDVDLLILFDCTAPFVTSQLGSFRAASVPILYVLGYGEQAAVAAPLELAKRHFENNCHITGLFGRDLYFPQAGVCFGSTRREHARALISDVYAVVSASPEAERLGVIDYIAFPFPTVEPKPTIIEAQAPIIVYGTEVGCGADVQEVVALPNSTFDLKIRSSWEGLSSVIDSRPGSRIEVSPEILAASPLAERVGLAALQERRNVLVSSNGFLQKPVGPGTTRNGEGEATPSVWEDWIGNLALCAQLARYIAKRRRASPRRPKVGIFLNSEMFSGSEVYGLMLARGLARVGCQVRIFVPEERVYGKDSDPGPLNTWLSAHDLPSCDYAPYHPGVAYFAGTKSQNSDRVACLSAFVGRHELDLVVCSGFMPVFAAMPASGFLVFMALFQPSAYRPEDLAFLRGRVSGVMSDSNWSADVYRQIFGEPTGLVRAMLPIDSSPPPQRTDKVGPVRVAIGGTLQPRKRQLQAIEAIRILHDRGEAVQLNIYGYRLGMLDGYIRDIDEAIRAHRLEDFVCCRGLVAMHEIARDNDIVLMASVDESLPQTLVDLMRLGLIGVAGLSGGIDEVIEDGATGYLTSDLSPSGLASALQRAINDRHRWGEVTTNARQRIDRDYSIQRNTTALLNLLIKGAQIEGSKFGRLAFAEQN